jgi:hypothetical protein
VTCEVPVRSKAQIRREIEAASAGEEPLFESLYAYRKLAGGTLSFNATSFPIQVRSLPPRLVIFTATYSRRLDGMRFSAGTKVEVKNAQGLGVSPSTGTPSEAAVEPPTPFAGSAEFALESPTVASWTGDLRVPIPTLGTVALTGPEFKRSLCGAGGCTDTAPGTQVAIFSGSYFTGNLSRE